MEAVYHEMKRRGAEAVVLLGNSGGGSLMALAHAERGIGDGWIGMAAHPGEGVFMLQVIDPSVADEADPFSRSCPSSTCTTRTTAGGRGRSRRRTTRTGWRPTGRPSSTGWPASTPSPRRRSPRPRTAASAAGAIDKAADPAAWRHWRARAVSMKYLVIYRTLADPAYLDLSIDPDDRALGSLFAFPDPLDANYGRGGLARSMTARGWLSTWSGLSSHAKLADTMPKVRCRRCSCTRRPTPRSGSGRPRRSSTTPAPRTPRYVEMKGAPHYLEGHRPEALAVVADWLGKRFP